MKPKKVWLTVVTEDLSFWNVYPTKKAATEGLWEDEIVAGPYVLEAPAAKKPKKKARK